MKLSLHFGCQQKVLELPDHLVVHVLTPTDPPLLQNPADELHRQLVGHQSTRLGIVGSPKKVAIVVPDETRPFPVRELLPVLMSHLRDWWPALGAEDITIHVGGGLHPPLNEDGLARVVPPEIRHGARVVPHDARNDALTHVGCTSRGTPVDISRAFARAEVRIVMGQIDPHQFVGFTGGAKGACIGLAGAETIRCNHSLLSQDNARPGILHTNPVREDLNEAGDLLGIHLTINVVNGPQKKPIWLGVGNHRAVLEAGSKVCAKVFGICINTPYDMVLASCGGHPKDINLYQAQKGLFNASMAARIGGRVLLLAACPQGVGDPAYFEYASRFTSMQAMVDDYQSHTFRMGAHKGYLFSRSTLNREVVLDCGLDNKVLSRCHLTPGTAQETIERWLPSLPDTARVAVVPYANTTYFHYGKACAANAR